MLPKALMQLKINPQRRKDAYSAYVASYLEFVANMKKKCLTTLHNEDFIHNFMNLEVTRDLFYIASR